MILKSGFFKLINQFGSGLTEVHLIHSLKAHFQVLWGRELLVFEAFEYLVAAVHFIDELIDPARIRLYPFKYSSIAIRDILHMIFMVSVVPDASGAQVVIVNGTVKLNVFIGMLVALEHEALLGFTTVFLGFEVLDHLNLIR